MKILLVQPNIEIGNISNNLETCASLIEHQLKSDKTDLIVLPEMFSTGFSFEASLAAEESGRTLDFMKNLTQKYNCAVCGSMAVKENGKFFNRLCFLTSQGDSFFYDKHHLFSYSGENESYAPGEKRVIVKWMGWNILLQTCYDLRFPVFSRNRIVSKNETEGVLYEYDAIIYVASWPSSRIEAWETLLKARAIENACYVIGSNASESIAGGHSSVINFKGNIHNCCSLKGESDARIAEVDKQLLTDFRKKFPYLPDADTFLLVN